MDISINIICHVPVFIKVSYFENLSIEMLHYNQRSCFIYRETTMNRLVTLLIVSSVDFNVSLASISSFLLISKNIMFIIIFSIEKKTTE